MDVHINKLNKGPAGNSEHIVKVQLGINVPHGKQRQVLIYNEDKSLYYEGDIPPDVLELMGDQLKAFFHASLDEKGMVSLDRQAEWEDW